MTRSMFALALALFTLTPVATAQGADDEGPQRLTVEQARDEYIAAHHDGTLSAARAGELASALRPATLPRSYRSFDATLYWAAELRSVVRDEEIEASGVQQLEVLDQAVEAFEAFLADAEYMGREDRTGRVLDLLGMLTHAIATHGAVISGHGNDDAMDYIRMAATRELVEVSLYAEDTDAGELHWILSGLVNATADTSAAGSIGLPENRTRITELDIDSYFEHFLGQYRAYQFRTSLRRGELEAAQRHFDAGVEHLERAAHSAYTHTTQAVVVLHLSELLYDFPEAQAFGGTEAYLHHQYLAMMRAGEVLAHVATPGLLLGSEEARAQALFGQAMANQAVIHTEQRGAYAEARQLGHWMEAVTGNGLRVADWVHEAEPLTFRGWDSLSRVRIQFDFDWAWEIYYYASLAAASEWYAGDRLYDDPRALEFERFQWAYVDATQHAANLEGVEPADVDYMLSRTMELVRITCTWDSRDRLLQHTMLDLVSHLLTRTEHSDDRQPRPVLKMLGTVWHALNAQSTNGDTEADRMVEHLVELCGQLASLVEHSARTTRSLGTLPDDEAQQLADAVWALHQETAAQPTKSPVRLVSSLLASLAEELDTIAQTPVEPPAEEEGADAPAEPSPIRIKPLEPFGPERARAFQVGATLAGLAHFDGRTDKGIGSDDLRLPDPHAAVSWMPAWLSFNSDELFWTYLDVQPRVARSAEETAMIGETVEQMIQALAQLDERGTASQRTFLARRAGDLVHTEAEPGSTGSVSTQGSLPFLRMSFDRTTDLDEYVAMHNRGEGAQRHGTWGLVPAKVPEDRLEEALAILGQVTFRESLRGAVAAIDRGQTLDIWLLHGSGTWSIDQRTGSDPRVTLPGRSNTQLALGVYVDLSGGQLSLPFMAPR